MTSSFPAAGRIETQAAHPTLTQLLDDLDAGRLSAGELVRRCLDRIDAREAQVQAWEEVLRDEAIQAAREADAERAAGHDRLRRPLLGIPVGIKDIIDTVGVRTSLGSPIYRDRIPHWDAACVALLRRAGAIVLGKTVSTEFACFHAGKTRNPLSLDRTPGGSSSGSAAAVADGMVPFALGSQTAASLVRPAAYCGLWGYKASAGHLSLSGIRPLAESFDSLGVLARSPADLAMVRAVLRGSGMRGPAAIDPPRLGLVAPPAWKSCDPRVTAALHAVQAALGAQGIHTEWLEMDDLMQQASDHQRTVMAFEAARNYAYENDGHRQLLSDGFAQLLEDGGRLEEEAMSAAAGGLAGAEKTLSAIWTGVDAILTPAADGPAPLMTEGTGDPTFGRIWTALGCCAVALPAAVTAERLPIGLQLVGPRGADERLLDCANWLGSALPLPFAV